MSASGILRIGQLNASNSILFLCDMQEKFRYSNKSNELFISPRGYLGRGTLPYANETLTQA